jgi:predicted DNA-binding antitoxin AbrB/MazE fold protein
MLEQIEVIYENGVFRPVQSLAGRLQEHQRLLVTIDGIENGDNWLADANPSITLESVRQALAKVKGTLEDWVHAEREER